MFDWITGFVDSVGLFGIALLMFAENVFPPIPSELIMPLAGYNAAQGDQNIVLVIIAGTIGSLAGALLWYWIGLRIGIDRLKRLSAKHGRFVTVTPDEIEKAEGWFDRHGGLAVFIGRLIPTVRTFISVPAGFARMPMPRFLAYTIVGTTLWTAFLAILGYVLGSQYDQVGSWMDPVSTGIVVAIVLYYIYRVITFDPGKQSGDDGRPARDTGKS